MNAFKFFKQVGQARSVDFPSKVAENREMGKFQPGQKKPPTSGRKRGVANLSTSHLKTTLEALGADIPTRIAELLPQLPIERQMDVYLELMQYAFPKRKAVEVTQPKEEKCKVVVFMPSNGREAKGTPIMSQSQADSLYKNSDMHLPAEVQCLNSESND